MAARKPVEKAISVELTSKILRTVPQTEAFDFYVDIGKYHGKSAASLADFSEKLKTVHLKSIEFHFKRGDFERWIRETLGDEYLANGIGRMDKSVQGEALRAAIQRTVENRLNYLKQSGQ
jgi:DNA primase large subunit